MTVLLLNANALHIPLADESVNCCVTSPPYYGLRDYGTARWEGGTDPECDHTYAKGGRNPETSAKQITSAGTTFSQYEKVCKRCGAMRIDSQIGLEETPEQYVEKLVQVFREVHRVLREDGTLWLNLGDSYAGSGGAGGDYNKGGLKEGQPKYKSNFDVNRAKDRNTDKWSHPLKYAGNGIKPKDLLGIPWMVAFALRADGWYLRSDIIWHKPNPMPESVQDRPTKSHEYIFLLSKSAKYFYDAEAILEPAEWTSTQRWKQDIENQAGSTRANGGTKTNGNMKAVGGKLTIGQTKDGHKGAFSSNGKLRATMKNIDVPIRGTHSMHLARANGEKDTQYPARNKRTVWAVATKPYKEAHFATFPPALIEPCVLAGSARGDTVLDPFNGSGTTGAVALKHHRKYIGIELNPKYIKLTHKRLCAVQPVLFEAAP